MTTLTSTDDDATWTRYEAARRWIDVELVRPGKRKLDLEGKVRAARAFFAALGYPQRASPAVQVAGTSGKGSVATLIARGLEAAGLRAGLHVSPYLQAFTEKACVNGRLAHGLDVARAADLVRPAVEALHDDGSLPASVHGLAGLGVVFEVLRAAQVDLAVVECGVGGRYDLVQGLRRALSVVADLGLDHEDVLGRGLESIAWHKAGILEAGAPAVVLDGPGLPVLEDEARRVGARLTVVRPDEALRPIGSEGGGRKRGTSARRPSASIDARRALLRLPRLGEVEVELPAVGFQRRNAALAGFALDALAREGWPIEARHVVAALAGLRVAGRFEVLDPPGGTAPRRSGPVILDGAHNAQKAAALAAALGEGARATFVLGSTGGRDPRDLLRPLAPAARLVIATAPPLLGKEASSAAALASAARGLGIPAVAEPDPARALERALEAGGPVVVTGSLYLVGLLRARWFPTRSVVLQRTLWPG